MSICSLKTTPASQVPLTKHSHSPQGPRFVCFFACLFTHLSSLPSLPRTSNAQTLAASQSSLLNRLHPLALLMSEPLDLALLPHRMLSCPFIHSHWGESSSPEILQYIQCMLAVKTLLTPQSNVTFRFSECDYQKTAEKRERLIWRQHEGLRESTCALDPRT